MFRFVLLACLLNGVDEPLVCTDLVVMESEMACRILADGSGDNGFFFFSCLPVFDEEEEDVILGSGDEPYA